MPDVGESVPFGFAPPLFPWFVCSGGISGGLSEGGWLSLVPRGRTGPIAMGGYICDQEIGMEDPETSISECTNTRVIDIVRQQRIE